MKKIPLHYSMIEKLIKCSLLGLVFLSGPIGLADSPGHTQPDTALEDPDPCDEKDTPQCACQTCPKEEDGDGQKQDDKACSDATIADPIRLSNGEFYLARDYLIQKDGAFPMALKLHYSTFTPRYSVAGWGWAHNFNMRVYETDQGRLLLRDHLGKRKYFELEDGVYRSISSRLDRIIINPNGTYKLTRERNGQSFSFDAQGRLTSIFNGERGEWRLTYTSLSKEAVRAVPVRSNLNTDSVVLRDWKVSTVVEYQNGGATGRSYTFSYAGSGMIDTVVTQAGDELGFSYDEGTALDHGMLTTLEEPGDSLYTHTYNFSPQRYTKIYGFMESFGNNRCSDCSIRTNTYDLLGRVIRQTQGENNEGEDISFNYSALASSVNPYTEVTHQINLLTAGQNGEYFGTHIDTRRERYYFLIDEYTGVKRLNQKIVQRGGTWDTLGAPVDDWVVLYGDYGDDDGKVTAKTESNGSTKSINRVYHTGKVLATKERSHFIRSGVTNASGSATQDDGPLTTTWNFDALGRLVRKEEVQSDRPGEVFTKEYTYWLDTELVHERKVKLGTNNYLTTTELYYNIGSGPSSVAEHTGLLARTTTPKGHYTTYTYTTCAVDGAGNVTRLGGLKAGTQSYDADDNLLAQTTSSYDLRGLKTSYTDAGGVTTTTVYDTRHRVTSETVTGNAGGLLIERHYRYDGTNLVETREGTVAEGYRAMRYEYDSLNNKVRTLRYRVQNDPLALLGSAQEEANIADWEIQSEAVYDNQRWVRVASNALGQQSSYEYEPLGWQTSVTTPVSANLDSVRYSTYDRTGRKITSTTPRGAVMTYSYDGLDRIISESTQLVADGDIYRKNEFSYNAKGSIVQTRVYEGEATLFATTNYYYDLANRPVGVNWNPETGDQSGDLKFPHRTTYDLNNNIATVTDASGDTTTFEYDGLDRRIITIHPDSTPGDLSDNPRSQSFYDARQNMTHRQDERGIQVYEGYDEFNRFTHNSIETNQDWTDGAWMARPADVRSEVTTYNAWSQVLTALNVDRVAQNTVYDSFGLSRETSGNGRPTVEMDYTALDRPATRTLAAVGSIAAITESWTYDSANGALLVNHTDGAGNISTNRYGVDFRVVETIKSLNSSTIGTVNEDQSLVSYDALSRPISVIDEVGARQQVFYDVLDRPIAQHAADHPFLADGSANSTSEVGVKYTSYTQYSQVASITGADSYPIRFTYDAEGNRIGLTDNKSSDQPGDSFTNGTTTRWDYDERDRVVRKRYAYESETIFGDDYRYTYLDNNLVENMTDGAGNFVQYEYEDSRNLLLKIDYPTETDIVYGTLQVDGSVLSGYDKARRQTRFEDETGICTMTFDSLGRLSKSTQGNVAYEQVREYDEWSRQELVRFRPTGAADGDALEWTCAYTFDSAGRLNTLTDSQVSATPFTYSYHSDANLITSVTHPNGMVKTKTWEERGILTDLTITDGNSNILKSFDYGVNELRQRETIDREDGTELTLAYDQQRQLLSGEKTENGTLFPDYDFNYQYDEIGNWEIATNNTTAETATYTTNEQNQYTSIDSGSTAFSPTYDGNGSLLDDGSYTYEWQERNRLDKVTTTATGEYSHYRYDALGRRLEREDYTSAGGIIKITRFFYDGWNCVAEFETTTLGASFTRTKTYTWGIDLSGSMQGAGGVGGILAVTDEQITGTPSYHYACDGNGNVIALYDDNHTAVANYEYDPFGNVIAQSGSYADENPYQFSTKYVEPSGLVYYGYRYYKPENGRWLSRDPLAEYGGINLYGMVGNNTLNYIDAFGLYSFTETLEIHWQGFHSARIAIYEHNLTVAERVVESTWGGIAALGHTVGNELAHIQNAINHPDYWASRYGDLWYNRLDAADNILLVGEFLSDPDNFRELTCLLLDMYGDRYSGADGFQQLIEDLQVASIDTLIGLLTGKALLKLKLKAPKTGGSLSRRDYLNQKFGRSGNVNADINVRQEAFYNKLATQHINGSGKTQLGVFRGAPENYIERAQRTGRSYFDIGDNWYKVPKADRWGLNERFLKNVTDSGDQIFFNIPKYKINPWNKYSLMEIDYLTNKAGYRWVNQWSLAKP